MNFPPVLHYRSTRCTCSFKGLLLSRGFYPPRTQRSVETLRLRVGGVRSDLSGGFRLTRGSTKSVPISPRDNECLGLGIGLCERTESV